MPTTSSRPYGKLREIIEGRGGTMIYQRQGYRFGAWEIRLNDKIAIIEAEGRRTFPKLDGLYVPLAGVADPATWDDYENNLISDAEAQLLALLK